MKTRKENAIVVSALFHIFWRPLLVLFLVVLALVGFFVWYIPYMHSTSGTETFTPDVINRYANSSPLHQAGPLTKPYIVGKLVPIDWVMSGLPELDDPLYGVLPEGLKAKNAYDEIGTVVWVTCTSVWRFNYVIQSLPGTVTTPAYQEYCKVTVIDEQKSLIVGISDSFEGPYPPSQVTVGGPGPQFDGAPEEKMASYIEGLPRRP